MKYTVFYKPSAVKELEALPRTALVHYLIYRDDLLDAAAIRERLDEPDIPVNRVHLKLATQSPRTPIRHER